MSTLNERSGEYRVAREKTRRKVLRIIVVVILVVLAGFLCYTIWDGIRNKQYNSYKIVASFDRTDSNTVVYKNYGDNILKYSRDGASAIDSEGNVIWNGSVEMQSPMVDISGDYVAIADDGGKEIYVYSGSDAGTLIEVPLPIRNIRVASQGVVAAVLEDSTSNTVCLYDPYNSSEKLLVEVPTNVSSDGYPVDIELSSDGKSLVTAYLSVTKGVPESRVCFYNFSEVGQDKNRIVGGKTYDNTMIAKLDFINENTVCIMLDNGFSLFENMKQPEELCTERFDREIKSAVFDEGYVGFVFEEGGDAAMSGLKLYDASGKKVLDKKVDYQYEQVYMDKGEIIFLSGGGCSIIRTDGFCKFKGVFDSGAQYLFGTNEKDTYYMVDENRINIIELTEDNTQ
ncbi:MAG: hypothetical protein E7265_07890 [Lachnospiraceae bacterium]|nr:hypothetical protein [Lachnospiraceae bacterium]